MIDSDFDYVESLEFNSNDVLWETEQGLNGDLAVLPVTGVAGIIPKMENIEDFAKVLTDWPLKLKKTSTWYGIARKSRSR